MDFTDRQVRKLQQGKRLKFGRGLTVFHRKNGIFDWNFQSRIAGKVIKLTIGQYPDTPIDKALQTAIEWKALCKQGIHPREHEKRILEDCRKKSEDHAKKRIKFGEVLKKYELRSQLKDKPNTEKTVKDRKHTLEKHYWDMMDVPIIEITSSMLLDRFHSIGGQGGFISTARKSFRYLNPIFEFAIHTEKILEKNPIDPHKDLIKTSTSKNLNRLTINESQKLFEIINHLNHEDHLFYYKDKININSVTPIIKLQCDIISLLLLTGLRQQEIIQVKIDQVILSDQQIRNMEARGPYFEIIRNKQAQPMGIPITPPMSAIFKRRIKSAQQIGSQYVFPTTRPRGQDRPITKERGAYPILKTLMGDLSESENNQLSANVLRTTFASAAFELGISTDIINAITGHYSSIHTLQKVATGAYVKTTAEGNREWFNKINEKLLDEDMPFGAVIEETE